MRNRCRKILAAILLLGGLQAAALLAQPIPAYSPKAQAVREAAALRLRGDRLLERGQAGEAREAWRNAVEIYRWAGYRIGEIDLLFQIAASYQANRSSRPDVRMLDSMAEGAWVTAQLVDDARRQAEPEGAVLDLGGLLLHQALSLVGSGDCERAGPLLEAARIEAAASGLATRELLALAGRLRCRPVWSGDSAHLARFLADLQELAKIAQTLQGRFEAGPGTRYLRAAESAELGRLQEAEDLLRSVILDLAAAGDLFGVARAELDLGYVLMKAGKLQEADPFLRLARARFAAWQDAASRRNHAAAERNLASLNAAVRIPEDT